MKKTIQSPVKKHTRFFLVLSVSNINISHDKVHNFVVNIVDLSEFISYCYKYNQRFQVYFLIFRLINQSAPSYSLLRRYCRKNMRYFCVDDDYPELSMVARRGYGGLAIFWKKEIDDKIKLMDEGNSRIQVIQIDTNASPICLINVKMPSDNKEMDCEYKDMISQLTEVIEKYRNTHEIVICGDMNGSAHRDKTSHDPLFKKFLLENRIGLSINYPEKDTFYHHNGKSSSAKKKKICRHTTYSNSSIQRPSSRN